FSTFLFGLIAALAAGVTVLGQAAVSSREPFVLELPGVSENRFKLPLVRIAQKEVPTLRVRVLNPFAEKITYGNIIPSLNGEGIKRSCLLTSDLEGKILTCARREDRLGGFQLLPGKNILEITAVDMANRDYYASYVLMFGDKTAEAVRPAWTNGAAEKFTGKKFAV